MITKKQYAANMAVINGILGRTPAPAPKRRLSDAEVIDAIAVGNIDLVRDDPRYRNAARRIARRDAGLMRDDY